MTASIPSVYILSVNLNNGHRPDLIPFSDEEKLRAHLCELIARHGLRDMSDELKGPLIARLEAKNYEEAITLYRRAQIENPIRLQLDFYWTKPVVIM